MSPRSFSGFSCGMKASVRPTPSCAREMSGSGASAIAASSVRRVTTAWVMSEHPLRDFGLRPFELQPLRLGALPVRRRDRFADGGEDLRERIDLSLGLEIAHGACIRREI